MQNEIAKRIREIRKQAGLTQAEFAEAIGTAQSAVSKWERALEAPSSPNLLAIARFGGVDVVTMDGDGATLAEAPVAPTKVAVVGVTQAGLWRESPRGAPSETIEMSIPSGFGWEKFHPVAFRVNGEIMNLVYSKRTIVFVELYSSGRLKPSPGDKVIVQRRSSMGLYEISIREMREDDNGEIWLWPRSRDPRHQAPIKLSDGAGDAVETHIVGVVIGALVREH